MVLPVADWRQARDQPSHQRPRRGGVLPEAKIAVAAPSQAGSCAPGKPPWAAALPRCQGPTAEELRLWRLTLSTLGATTGGQREAGAGLHRAWLAQTDGAAAAACGQQQAPACRYLRFVGVLELSSNVRVGCPVIAQLPERGSRRGPGCRRQNRQGGTLWAHLLGASGCRCVQLVVVHRPVLRCQLPGAMGRAPEHRPMWWPRTPLC